MCTALDDLAASTTRIKSAARMVLRRGNDDAGPSGHPRSALLESTTLTHYPGCWWLHPEPGYAIFENDTRQSQTLLFTTLRR